MCVYSLIRFTMVYSELPDMSDSSHDFVQQHIQKEKDQQVYTLMTMQLFI